MEEKMEIVKETHARTTAKTVSYRASTIVSVMAIAYFIFNDLGIAGGMGFMSLFLGTAIYYLHDRIWLFLKWNRDEEGKDGVTRSTVKTVTYRVLTMIAVALTVKLVTGGEASNTQVASFVIAQMVVNLILFFIIERIFNVIEWGKIKTTEEVSKIDEKVA